MFRTLLYIVIFCSAICVLQSCCNKDQCVSVYGISIPVNCNSLPYNMRSTIITYRYNKYNGVTYDSVTYSNPATFNITVQSRPDQKFNERDYNHVIVLANGRQDTIYDVDYRLNTYSCPGCGFPGSKNSGSSQYYTIENPTYYYKQQQYNGSQEVVILP